MKISENLNEGDILEKPKKSSKQRNLEAKLWNRLRHLNKATNCSLISLFFVWTTISLIVLCPSQEQQVLSWKINKNSQKSKNHQMSWKVIMLIETFLVIIFADILPDHQQALSSITKDHGHVSFTGNTWWFFLWLIMINQCVTYPVFVIALSNETSVIGMVNRPPWWP